MKLLAFLLLFIPTVSHALVEFDKSTATLKIVGPTDMVQTIDATNALREHDVDYIIMWGPGGRLKMGIQLGNMINKEDATVVIPKDKACISACAFAAMGSKHIRIDGKLMLHRPYIAGVNPMITLEESLAHMGKGYLLVAYYLEDLGYNRSVLDQIMKYTSPCKFMTYEDLEVKDPQDLILWVNEDRCEMLKMMRRLQR